jgi:hypothetical protein
MSRPAIVTFFRLFPELSLSVSSFDSLKDGIAIQSVYIYLSGEPSPTDSSQSGSSPWIPVFKRFRYIHSKLTEIHKGTRFELSCDATGLARRGTESDLENIAVMLIAYALKSPKRESVEAQLATLSESESKAIRAIVEGPPDQSQALSPPPTPVRTTPPASPDDSQLANAVQTLRAEVAALKEKAEPAVLDKELETAKAELFAEEVRCQTKRQRLDGLLAVEEHLNGLHQQIQELKDRIGLLEGGKSDPNSGLDYAVLTDRLQELHLDPGLQVVEELEEQSRKLKRQRKAVKARTDALLARRDGHQSFAVLNERLVFRRKLEAVNIVRRWRAKLNVMTLQKKMRQETFQFEMQNFL